MHIVTLLTAPAAPTLDAALIDSLRNAWGGGEARWLAPGEAAEFDLQTRPENFWDVWADVQNLGVDLVVQQIQSLEDPERSDALQRDAGTCQPGLQ